MVFNIFEDEEGCLVELFLLRELSFLPFLVTQFDIESSLLFIKLQLLDRMSKFTVLRFHDADSPEVEPTQWCLRSDLPPRLDKLIKFLTMLRVLYRCDRISTKLLILLEPLLHYFTSLIQYYSFIINQQFYLYSILKSWKTQPLRGFKIWVNLLNLAGMRIGMFIFINFYLFWN